MGSKQMIRISEIKIMRLPKAKIILFLGIMLFSWQVKALYLSSLIFDMPSDKKFISRPLSNDTGRPNLYTVTSYKIDKPGKNGEHPIDSADKEIIYTPLKFTLKTGSLDYFKLFYRGPEDDKERYYRIIFKESPITLFPIQNKTKNLDIIPTIAVSTILVVRPRKMTLNYHIDEKSGILKNIGNTFFRVIIQKGCNGDDESSTQFYMLPGETYTSPSLKANNKKFIVIPGRYVHMGEGCFK